MTAKSPLSYESYLKIPELTGIQAPLAEPSAHDELQFIVVHQTYELWFKLLTHEIQAMIAFLKKGNLPQSIWIIKRCNEITRVLNQQILVMETMSPASFLEFRNLLNPASGLQSYQFRCLEFMSGLKHERYLGLYEPGSIGHTALAKALIEPTIWDAFMTHLESQGFKVEGEADQLASLKIIYTESKWDSIHFFCESLMDYDESFRVWRHRHFLMAERMIGFKPGTGHQELPKIKHPESGALPSSESGQAFRDAGVHYLKSRTEPRYFPLLWELRTHLG